ncbi:hypothetical protein Ae168Ps1_0828c [Pseudonocardia sp. Ae168_Ps1]|nr:hypothetical protein Ae150APs1_0828c [Pseudonocardia sp. Ae150A_Ps1]OLL78422.1 hypothetical protein Ae168Ps1_0828c [Pseudonocardia sp. Ae168_Ps1]OLL87452.1 hypothetical protein Ae263Ps1_4507 [Pseudonocardia sp. Ae263_Ps1]OLL92519.1 hypothetical protein Ae356Ps1_2416c [Pseudonocardia sp. Ae356_Ps1]
MVGGAGVAPFVAINGPSHPERGPYPLRGEDDA